jgi:hypothetical protein
MWNYDFLQCDAKTYESPGASSSLIVFCLEGVRSIGRDETSSAGIFGLYFFFVCCDLWRPFIAAKIFEEFVSQFEFLQELWLQFMLSFSIGA